MSTQFGKWLLAGVVAISATMTQQRALAYGEDSTEALVTGLAIGAVAATLVRDDDRHYSRDTYREVHYYHDEPRYYRPAYYGGYRHCPPRRVEVDNYYYNNGHHGHGGHHGGGYRHEGRYDYNRGGGYRDVNRTVIVNHF